MTFAITGSAEPIRELLCGPIQHNEHMKAWRWHMYVQDDAKRWASVQAEMRKMRAERLAMTSQQHADELLAVHQAARQAMR